MTSHLFDYKVYMRNNPDVTAISERIAEDNQNDMCMCVYSSIHGYHILFGATTYRFRIMNRHTLCSFHGILSQAVEQLDYRWHYAGSRSTLHGLQGHLHFALGPSVFATPPVYSIFGRPSAQTCEAKERVPNHV